MNHYLLETPFGYRSFWLPQARLPVVHVHVVKPPENLWLDQPLPPLQGSTVEVHDYYPTNECIPVWRDGRLYCANIYRMER